MLAALDPLPASIDLGVGCHGAHDGCGADFYFASLSMIRSRAECRFRRRLSISDSAWACRYTEFRLTLYFLAIQAGLLQVRNACSISSRLGWEQIVQWHSCRPWLPRRLFLCGSSFSLSWFGVSHFAHLM